MIAIFKKNVLPVVFCLACQISFAQRNSNAQNSQDSFHSHMDAGYKYLNPDRGRALTEFQSAIQIASELDDSKLIAEGFEGAGQALWYANDFRGAIDTMEISVQYFRKTSSTEDIAEALRILSNIYDEHGDYEKAFVTIREGLELCSHGDGWQNTLLSLVQIGVLYQHIGDYPTAMEYFHKALEMHPVVGSYEYRHLYTSIGNLYTARGRQDSVLYYYHSAMIGHPSPMTMDLAIGQYYRLRNKTDSALFYLLRAWYQTNSITDINIRIPAMIGLGNIYLEAGRMDSALNMAKNALDLSIEKGVSQDRRDACLLMSSVYEKTGDTGKAFKYYKQYILLKDQVISEELKAKLYTFKQNSADEKRAEELNKLKNQKRLLAGVIIYISIAAFLTFFIIALRHNNEKLRLKQRSSELEMQALRAQMNPHFIFNCLSAINHFILNNEADKASNYLVRFSRLIRLVMVNSSKTTISLEEELDTLKLYLAMEQLRFKDAFEYEISFARGIQPSMIQVPSFIFQPYCENAIWHGLLHRQGKGKLSIQFDMDRHQLVCTITDNGIGRKKAAEVKTTSAENKGSYGHQLSSERLSLFNKEKHSKVSVLIEDLPEGTRVILRINHTLA